MSRSARKSSATKELLRHVAKRSTGRLAVASPSGALTITLMAGDILGAESPGDESSLLRRIRLAGTIPARRLGELHKLVLAGQGIFGNLLDEVPGEVLEPLLFERYRDNVVAFVAQDDMPRFEPLPGVFVDNMQMGQNAARLIDAACTDADAARRVDPEMLIVRGTGRGRDELAQSVLDEATDEPRTVSAVLDQVAVEPWFGLALVASLLETGALRTPDADPRRSSDRSPEPPRSAERRTAAPVDPNAPTVAPDDEIDPDEESDSPTVNVQRPVFTSSATPPPPPRAPTPPPAAPRVPAAAEPDPELLSEDDILLDDPTVLPDASFEEEPSEGVPRPEDMSLWVDGGNHLSEEDLAFFEDHEDDRGAGGGGFSTQSHNLDKVVVGAEGAAPPKPPPAQPVEEIIEAEEAPTARFAAPVLSETDALEKIEVCNDVLRRVAAAFDATEGSGRGRAAVQLLVDGSPSKYTALLHDLNVGEEGDLPADQVLDNLTSRPTSEHRQLINGALKNVIERALSSAADELPEESFNDLYESVAGYNQRLGL